MVTLEKNAHMKGPVSQNGMHPEKPESDAPRSTMKAQMKELTDLLEEAGIAYWVDSGTLLGLVREGDFIAWDKDIDLSVWADELPRLDALRPRLKEMGYDPWPSYMGPPFVLSLVPRREQRKDGKIGINIGGHFKDEGKAYRLVWDVRKNRFARKDPRHWLSEIYRFPLHVSVFAARSRIGAKPLVGRWPWTLIIEPGYWEVPVALLEKTTRHGPTGFKIPVRAEEYLALRYGDWRTPVKDWDYKRDDGAYRSGVPAFLRGKT